MTINTIEDFQKLITQLQEQRLLGVIGQKEFQQEYLRGQSKDSYKLTSSISRGIEKVEDLQEVETNYLKEFKEGLKNIGKENLLRESNENFKSFTEWELLWQLQHYELPTRLLDWTTDAHIALYFAVKDEDQDDFDGQFWILKLPMNFHDHNYEYLDSSIQEFKETKLLNPYFNEENDFDNQIAELRRMRQNGKFLFQNYHNSLIPMEEQELFKPYLEKKLIPKECKKIFREYLAEKGFTKERVEPERNESIVQLVNSIKE